MRHLSPVKLVKTIVDLLTIRFFVSFLSNKNNRKIENMLLDIESVSLSKQTLSLSLENVLFIFSFSQPLRWNPGGPGLSSPSVRYRRRRRCKMLGGELLVTRFAILYVLNSADERACVQSVYGRGKPDALRPQGNLIERRMVKEQTKRPKAHGLGWKFFCFFFFFLSGAGPFVSLHSPTGNVLSLRAGRLSLENLFLLFNSPERDKLWQVGNKQNVTEWEKIKSNFYSLLHGQHDNEANVSRHGQNA